MVSKILCVQHACTSYMRSVLSVFCFRLYANNIGDDGAKALAPSLANLTNLTVLKYVICFSE